MLKRNKSSLIKLGVAVNILVYFAWTLGLERCVHANTRYDRWVEGKVHAKQNLETGLFASEPNSSRSNDSFYGEGCGKNPHRKQLKQLLMFWSKLTRGKGIEYFLCYGSLLAYQRDRDFIPYDHDIDFCIYKKHFVRLLKLESRSAITTEHNKPHLFIVKRFSNGSRLNCNGTLVSTRTDPCSANIIESAARVILGKRNFIDVYIYTISKRYNASPNLKLEPSDVYPTTPCWLAGVETRCPGKPKALSEKFYGPGVVEKPSYVCKDHQFVVSDKSKANEKLRSYIKYANRLLLKKVKSEKWRRRDTILGLRTGSILESHTASLRKDTSMTK